jgi:hypothetical protein
MRAQACDVPSERSEFAHHDTALVLSTLARYYDGLDEAEVLEAFEALMRQKSESEQVGPPHSYRVAWCARQFTCERKGAQL